MNTATPANMAFIRSRTKGSGSEGRSSARLALARFSARLDLDLDLATLSFLFGGKV
jgi:hypothetical protein